MSQWSLQILYEHPHTGLTKSVHYYITKAFKLIADQILQPRSWKALKTILMHSAEVFGHSTGTPGVLHCANWPGAFTQKQTSF